MSWSGCWTRSSAPLHNRHLNETAAFAERNPTAENVTLHVAEALRLPAAIRLGSVEVWETEDCSAAYRPEE